MIVKNFVFEYVDVEDILIVVCLYLGLVIGELIGIDVSVFFDLFGKNIFVMGVVDKV